MESKVVATERLRREGRWEQASKFREEARQRFRDEGMNRRSANEAAWKVMKMEFPPLALGAAVGAGTTGPDSGTENELKALAERCANDPPNVGRDILWAYQNLANPVATPQAAPSLGAWAMLGWAKSSPATFFERLLPKALSIAPRPPTPNEPPPRASREEAGESEHLKFLRKQLERYTTSESSV